MCSELTDREWSTLVLLTDATLSQKDVARSLGITLNTLKTHLRSLYQKLGAHSRAEAIELGLLRGHRMITAGHSWLVGLILRS
jgi:DNA-binding CsgD family transcriptional regulator